MSLSVLSPAPVRDLIELTSVKSRLGIDGTSDDLELARMIAEVSDALCQPFGRLLARQTYRETFAPTGCVSELRLSAPPIDPDSVMVTLNGGASTDFEVANAGAGLLYRSSGWPSRSSNTSPVVITYSGGFLLPGAAPGKGRVSDWGAATVVTVGIWARAVASLSALRFECTTAGTTGGTEPSWPDEGGETVGDGGAIWTARQAEELPPTLQALALLGIKDLRESATRPSGLVADEADGWAQRYSAQHVPGGVLSTGILDALETFRLRWAA